MLESIVYNMYLNINLRPILKYKLKNIIVLCFNLYGYDKLELCRIIFSLNLFAI